MTILILFQCHGLYLTIVLLNHALKVYILNILKHTGFIPDFSASETRRAHRVLLCILNLVYHRTNYFEYLFFGLKRTVINDNFSNVRICICFSKVEPLMVDCGEPH